ncbi:hypothetical protein RHGRI_005986 [Rhododendron griersonianum]|uniref:Uncharacterized protein n=1 Tax=Rhododendron griersonianum TaxID=479676 RepID=A0AAV6LGD2_9ERIC|nr:hypothetical protein RHGRI_005986 [Rhododendron griersonianum]
MEKAQEKPVSVVWDCGSSLYDSFERKSLERQLHSAIISSRTLSMPHLSDRRAAHLPPPPPPRKPEPLPTQHVAKKYSSKFSVSFQKLVRFVFGPKQSSKNPLFKKRDGAIAGFDDHFFYGPGALYTIPEVAEGGRDYHGGSPDFNSALVGRSVSDRFTSTASVGVSCA